MPELARIPRRTRTPQHTLPPQLPRLPVSLLFCPNPSECRLRCLTTAPSAKISRRRGNPPRHYHRPQSPQPQLQLQPRRNCSDPSLAAKSNRRTYVAELVQRFCEATINTC